MRNEDVLAEAEFDERLPIYFMLQVQVVLLVSVFTIPLMPLWLLFGRAVHRRQYENLSARLTGRTLQIRRGLLFKVQKSIPLDKITDLAVNEGPILRYFGLCSLNVETAGGGHGSTMGQANLPGVKNAEEFRDRVLEQRDRIALGTAPPVTDRDLTSTETARAVEGSSTEAILQEIRDLVRQIAERQST